MRYRAFRARRKLNAARPDLGRHDRISLGSTLVHLPRAVLHAACPMQIVYVPYNGTKITHKQMNGCPVDPTHPPQRRATLPVTHKRPQPKSPSSPRGVLAACAEKMPMQLLIAVGMTGSFEPRTAGAEPAGKRSQVAREDSGENPWTAHC
jgi:hypothetical protein